jgi:magnesium chelatase subunit D
MMTALPLTALVALDEPKLALLLLAVEPRLAGVVWAGPAGSGKSAILDGYRQLLPATPVLTLPLGADEEALLGGTDLEATLQRGERVIQPGLLARAHGGALMVDSCNLLQDSATNVLMSALDQGVLHLEREGLSQRLEARFALLATFDPAEGRPRSHLLDRIGLIAQMPALKESHHRRAIIERHTVEWNAFQQGTGASDWQDELEMLQALVQMARAQLPTVQITPAQINELSTTALSLGIEGHRADFFALLAARASAALALRDEVDDADLQVALRYVLLPRATRLPPIAAPEPTEVSAPESAAPESAAPAEASAQPSDGTHEEAGHESALPAADQLALTPQILEAAAAELPSLFDSLPFHHQQHAASGSRGSTTGQRGRHVGSRPGTAREGKIDLLATLRAAARWQRLRSGPRRVKIQADDLRIKQFRSKAGALFIFAVDASGSMALNRMRQAKGAVHAMLEQAYVNRDRVALLAFRQQAAEILLPPTNSVELLRRAVDQLPTGGGTPIAAALLSALDLASQARRRGCHQVVLVLLTDGRANIGLRVERAQVDEELQRVARQVALEGIKSLIIDTQRNFLSQGAAQKLASALGGQYLYLPGARGDVIATAIRCATGLAPHSSARHVVQPPGARTQKLG